MSSEANGPQRPDLLRRRELLPLGAAAALACVSAPAAAQMLPGPRVDHVALARLFGIAGKVCVLTDSGGKGSREVALLLAAAGGRIVVADQAFGRPEETAAAVRAAGAEAVAIETTIEDEASVVALFERATEQFGGVDILVNCAGLLLNGPFEQITLQQWIDSEAVNLRANFLTMREAVKRMRAGGRGGRIINITTIGAVHPVQNGNQAYSAARAGVTMLTNATALDYAADNIRANVVMAGAIRNKVRFHESTTAAEASGWTRGGPVHQPGRLPLGYGDMEDVAAAVLYLASPAGDYITGQQIVLDGGFLIS